MRFLTVNLRFCLGSALVLHQICFTYLSDFFQELHILITLYFQFYLSLFTLFYRFYFSFAT